MHKKISLWVIVILMMTVYCAPTNASRYREGSNVDQETTLTVQEEQRLTREALPQIQKDYPSAKNQELQKYISDPGMKIIRANHLEGNPYHYTFAVVDVADVNTFAMPAGTIFITAPLIALASSEAELAGVVSHEIGHVVARQTAERMSAMEKSQNKIWIYANGRAAGYDKDQVGKFYEKLLEIERKSGRGDGVVVKNLADAMSTHPPSEERVRQMQSLAAQSPARPSITSTQPFNRAKQIAAKLGKNKRAHRSINHFCFIVYYRPVRRNDAGTAADGDDQPEFPPRFYDRSPVDCRSRHSGITAAGCPSAGPGAFSSKACCFRRDSPYRLFDSAVDGV